MPWERRSSSSPDVSDSGFRDWSLGRKRETRRKRRSKKEDHDGEVYYLFARTKDDSAMMPASLHLRIVHPPSATPTAQLSTSAHANTGDCYGMPKEALILWHYGGLVYAWCSPAGATGGGARARASAGGTSVLPRRKAWEACRYRVSCMALSSLPPCQITVGADRYRNPSSPQTESLVEGIAPGTVLGWTPASKLYPNAQWGGRLRRTRAAYRMW